MPAITLFRRTNKEEEMVMMAMLWESLGSKAAAIMFGWAMFQRYFPQQLQSFLSKYYHQFRAFFNPYIEITFHESTSYSFKRSDLYSNIDSYLTSNSSKRAKRLKATAGTNTRNLVLSMDDCEQITDDFQGIKFWWSSNKIVSTTPSFSFYPSAASNYNHYYKLTFHKRYRDLITTTYLNHVMEKGKIIKARNRQQKLHTNNKSDSWHGRSSSEWSHVVFNHPSTFQTLAMEPQKKKEIMDDLVNFSNSKDYYKKVGKAWKRGYLLYGPPGTGKSSMIAAMANLLDYDIYDLELTAVKNNMELRQLLINTNRKSIIVIEDIDCSLDLTGHRKDKKKKKEKEEGEKEKKEGEEEEKSKDKESKVTLSGLLNFIDGLWSACGGERLIVFTTNYVEKLDPALIRRGRMDKHIEMSYCSYGGFKVLAKNYLDLDSHPLFETIHRLMDETQITPADVAENLMPKSLGENAKVDCLEALIHALHVAKEGSIVKSQEELTCLENETTV